jgi:hypothetical protein
MSNEEKKATITARIPTADLKALKHAAVDGGTTVGALFLAAARMGDPKLFGNVSSANDKKADVADSISVDSVFG